ncbi:T9SS type A sorting domain-containing protein, partial [Candidatus Bipolaricaulota bacterium]|nr:T9SS type A sorting domain-containing protein [Candidatus Bipolaricaulota bacterium]
SVPKSTLEIKNVPNPITDVNTTTFVVEGETAWQVERIRVAIYDLSGRLIYEDEEEGTTLIWHTQSQDGAYLANGAYLYRVWLRIGDQWVLTDVRKLAILR